MYIGRLWLLYLLAAVEARPPAFIWFSDHSALFSSGLDFRKVPNAVYTAKLCSGSIANDIFIDFINKKNCAGRRMRNFQYDFDGLSMFSYFIPTANCLSNFKCYHIS